MTRCALSAEAWIYPGRANDGSTLLLLFTRSRFGNAYVLAFDPRAPDCGPEGTLDFFSELAGFDGRYGHWVHSAAANYMAWIRSAGGAVVAAPTPSETIEDKALASTLAEHNLDMASDMAREVAGEVRYAAPLPAAFEFLDFASYNSAGATDLTLSVALPAGGMRLPAESSSSPRDASIRARTYASRLVLAVTDSATGRLIARLDTTRSFRMAQPLGDSALVETHAELELPPGTYRYTLRLEGGEAAVGDSTVSPTKETPTSASVWLGAGSVTRGRLVVPALSPAPAGTLRLSSLAFGRGAAGASGWQRDGEPLALIPTHVVPLDRRVSVYYEVYGLAEGERIMTEVTIEKRNTGLFSKKNQLQLGFRDEARLPKSGWMPVGRTLDLRQLERGDYTLRLRVTGADGKTSHEESTVVLLR